MYDFSTMSLSFSLIFTLSLLSLPLTFCKTQTGPTLRTKLGNIRGTILTSDEGADIYAFRGIPYAKPPIKELRFSPPQPYDEEYNGVLHATEDGKVCVQYNQLSKTFQGDEDCLYLNVYTPKFSSQDFTKLLPVMFWLHGGGFFIGSGSLAEYGPQRLIDRNVILVTINYRLGSFGFLSTMDEASPGNYGLLDQVLALRWVRDNIASFGGDPDKVTIFGESAGSISVGFHLLSPLSKGLFHAAIAQSGSAFAETIVAQDESKSLYFTKEVAKLLNCPTSNNKKMVNCMRKKPALDVIRKSALTIDAYIEKSGDLITFKPVVDAAHGTNAFLPDFPQKLMMTKRFNSVPLMAGINKDEGIFFLGALNGFGGVGAFGKEHIPLLLKHVTPSKFSDEEHASKSSQILADKYFRNFEGTNIMQKVVALNKFLGDLIINYMVDVQNDNFVENNVPTYCYKFTHKGEHSLLDSLPLKSFLPEEMKLVNHGDELQNLFHSSFFKDNVMSRETDRKMSDIMLTLWTNFAKKGVPTMDSSAYEQPLFNWEPSTTTNRQYLELRSNPRMVKGHLSFNYDILTNIYTTAKARKVEL